MSAKRPRFQIAKEAPNPLPGVRQTKRKRDDSAISPPSRNEKSTEQPRTPPATPSTTLKDTPRRWGSSQPNSTPIQPAHSSQNRAIKETLPAASADDAKRYRKSLSHPGLNRSQMEKILRVEVDGAVYEYPKLCEEFFHLDKPQVNDILVTLANSEEPLLRRNGRWFIDCSNLNNLEGKKMHRTCASLLDTVMRAAFRPSPFRPTAQEIVPSMDICLVGNHSDDVEISPDIVQGLAGDHKRHWGDLEFFAECKAKPTKLGKALMQIARYSRALFTHQIYRKCIFSLAFCGTWATFIRISRSGLIHSQPINLETDPEIFIRAAAGLFLLDDAQFGYNTRFYYWPPLNQESNDRELRFVTDGMRWVVVETLCHRMCLVGRATIVLLLRRVNNSRHRAVLKLIWRPSTRTDENTNLENFQNCLGICRRRWGTCDEDATIQDLGSLQPSPFRNEFLELSKERTDEIYASLPTNSSSSQTAQYYSRINSAKKSEKGHAHFQSHSQLGARCYSMILMDEGVRLWRIKHLVHLLRVLRDGMIGYANLVMKGKVHRDISEGNILCGPRDSPEHEDFWLDEGPDSDTSEGSVNLLDDASDRYEFDDVSFLVPEEELAENLSFSEYILRRYSKQQPLGRLFDFEFMVDELRGDEEVRKVADRTGTPAFILDAQSEEYFVKLFLQDGAEDTKELILTTNSDRREELVRKLVGDDIYWKGAHVFATNLSIPLAKYLYPQNSGSKPVRSVNDVEIPNLQPEEYSVANMGIKERWELIHQLVGVFDLAIQQLQSRYTCESGIPV